MADSTLSLSVPTDQLLVGLVAFALVLVAWFLALRDLLRRDDLGTGAKVAWAVGIVVTGFVGAVLYFLLRPRGATESERAKLQQMSDDFVAEHSRSSPPAEPDETS